MSVHVSHFYYLERKVKPKVKLCIYRDKQDSMQMKPKPKEWIIGNSSTRNYCQNLPKKTEECKTNFSKFQSQKTKTKSKHLVLDPETKLLRQGKNLLMPTQ